MTFSTNTTLILWRELKIAEKSANTVDGRNPAPVDMVNIPLLHR